MVDEAHRTQYGLLGARMAQALPNAVLVGFTGTPLDKGFGRSTMGHFGSLIDAYTIPQSVADGATVRIMYEARLPDLSIQSPRELWTSCSTPSSTRRPRRSGPRYAGATPTRRPSRRRRNASR